MPLVENRWLDNAIVRGVKWSAALNDPAALLRRAKLLLRDDRLMVEMVLQGNLSRRQVGKALRLDAGTVTRRLQRVLARLCDPMVVAILDESCPLLPEYRQLGVEHFLQGRPIRTLAELHQMKRGDVGAALNYVRGWHRGVTAQKHRRWSKVTA